MRPTALFLLTVAVAAAANPADDRPASFAPPTAVQSQPQCVDAWTWGMVGFWTPEAGNLIDMGSGPFGRRFGDIAGYDNKIGYPSGSVGYSISPVMVGAGLEGEGVPGRVDHHSEVDPGAGDFTVELWYRRGANAPSEHDLFSKWDGSTDRGFRLFIDSTDELVLRLGDGTSPGGQPFTDFPSGIKLPAPSQLHHLAVTVDRDDSDGLTFYLDGSPTTDHDPTSRSGSLSNTEPISVPLEGAWDELTLYDEWLDPDRINWIWSVQSVGKCREPTWHSVPYSYSGPPRDTIDLRAVHGLSGSYLVVAGGRGQPVEPWLFRLNGTVLEAPYTGDASNAFGAWMAPDSSLVFAIRSPQRNAGYLRMRRTQGQESWGRVCPTPGQMGNFGVWGFAPHRILLTGDSARWSGPGGVGGAKSGTAHWWVGQGGDPEPCSGVAQDPESWELLETGDGTRLWDAWGPDSANVVVVGRDGTALHWDGVAWTPMNTGTQEHLLAVWGFSGSEIFAVGSNGTVLRYDGAAWSSVSPAPPVQTHFRGVWGTAPDDLFVVGDGGTILHYGDTGGGQVGWTEHDSGTSKRLWDVWGVSDTIYAVGSDLTFIRRIR